VTATPDRARVPCRPSPCDAGATLVSRAEREPSDLEPGGLAALEVQPEPGPRAVGREFATDRRGHAVEQHAFDADVIAEVLDVAEPPHAEAYVCVQRGRGVRRDVEVVRVRECGRAQEAGEPGAAGGIELEHI